MSKAIPHAWRFCEFGDIAKKIEGGGTPARNNSEFWSGKIPWVTVKDLKKVRLSFAEESISELGLRESSSRLIPKNTLIIATRMALGKAVVFDKDVTINQDLKAVFPTDDVESEYLLQWYLSKSEYIQSMGTGSTVKGIRLDDLRLIPIKLPPLPEQQKIAAILTSVDDVIESTQAQISKLKDLKTGMMQELLTKGIGHSEFKDSPAGRIPKAWEVKSLGELTLEHKQGYYSKEQYSTDGIYVVRITDMQNPTISFDGMPKMKLNNSDFEAYKISIGDFLFARSGAIGRYGIYESTNDAVFASYLIRFRFNQNLALNKFIGYCYESDCCQSQIRAITQGSSNININAQYIKSLVIPVPNIKEQEKIVTNISGLDIKISSISKKLVTLQSMKKALMQDLLTGKVRVKVN